ncbi:MAG TPA: nodulation protein NfeD [Sulfurimonas sp.]|nr:nodulation protein NfeD [Sulfurimonas sp.]
MKKLYAFLLFLLLSLTLSANTITHLKIKGAISPATSSYLSKGFVYALENNSTSILISLDTPGGLSTSMREMIQEILNSPIPIIMYVSPKGARAASAGTYMMYASHVAVMSPGTNIGAATPVSMMKPPNVKDMNLSKTAMQKKVINDSIAYIKSLAQLRDRNISWAINAVKEGKSLSAQDALKYGVIDMMAENEYELWEKLEGKEVKVSTKMIKISQKDATHLHYKADWKNRLLSIITNPNIAYILLMIGAYGIFFELMHPGSVYPGVIGLISGVMALYALNLLPFSYAGLLLIFIGIALMIAEVFLSGFGILGIAGVVSFALGSLLLFDADTLGIGISIPLIMAFSLSSLAFFILLLRFVLKARKSTVVSGVEEMIGMQIQVISKKGSTYKVLCHGEVWSAKSQNELLPNEISYVESISGLILALKK